MSVLLQPVIIFLAHLNEERQKERADKKYNELTTSRALSASAFKWMV